MIEITLNWPLFYDWQAQRFFYGRRIGKRQYHNPVLGGEHGLDHIVYKDDGSVLLVYLRCPDGVKEVLRHGLKGFKEASKRKNAMRDADSGTVGFIAPSGVYAFGRSSGFTRHYREEWEMMLPTFEILHDLYEEHLPAQFAIQNEVAIKTSTDFLIPKVDGGYTCFTTGTVNGRHQFPCHIDEKNLAGAMSVMTVWREENPRDYQGCFTVFPQWGVAVNMQLGDVLIFDGYDLHGNSPFQGYGKRISIIAYYQSRIQECGSFEDEEEKAKRLVRSDWQKAGADTLRSK